MGRDEIRVKRENVEIESKKSESHLDYICFRSHKRELG